MRMLITASGIQDYLFDITQKAASARLRGRSAQLGLVLDLCRQRISEKFTSLRVLRNAGSRLEVEVIASSESVDEMANQLQLLLDDYSRERLDGQVWFTAAVAESSKALYHALNVNKLKPGRAVLQKDGVWNENAFVVMRKTDERRLQRSERDEARELPDALLGRSLARHRNQYVRFVENRPQDAPAVAILDRFLEFSEKDPGKFCFRFTLTSGTDNRDPHLISKRLCRYAPMDDTGHHLLDLNDIAERSRGAKFLGVLKADLDNAGILFQQCPTEQEKERLSHNLDVLFTERLESLIMKESSDCYVVYSGGDDLFLLGPWDQVIHFAVRFQQELESSVRTWGLKPLTISAGIKLSSPGSAVRHLADEADAALNMAKGRQGKNGITIFERVLNWSEVTAGISWANEFIGSGETTSVPKGFLYRLQYYAGESRRYFEHRELGALHMIPLLHNDWERNSHAVEQSLADRMERDILPRLRSLRQEEAEPMWRIMDFASRYASYAVRESEGRSRS